ncbi:Nitrite reductase (NADH) small subunit [Halomonadaceae bacterium LMG 33818]|uniref:nitrite reductase small subunit NirD n=1 Tax=Cernens ardua TaxID=3402176 RepID=UPI003EDBF8DA
MSPVESTFGEKRAEPSGEWTPLCHYEDLASNAGVTVYHGQTQIALFLLKNRADTTERIYAVSNKDPFSGANVIGRGIVGDVDGIPAVASPLYKQHFNLSTGECLESPEVTLTTWPVRVSEGIIEIGG